MTFKECFASKKIIDIQINIVRSFKFFTMKRVGKVTVSLLICILLALSSLLWLSTDSDALAWDSANFPNFTHATHSYITEWAIDQLKAQAPDLDKYRKPLLEGANMELHELEVKGHPIKYGIDLEAKRKQHKGTNEGCDDIQGWWQDSLAAYKQGNREQAYFLLGIVLHMIEDMGVPAHANKVYHQGNATEFDNFEFMALSNWKPSFNDINRSDPQYDEPWKYYNFSRDWTKADAPDYNNRDKFSKFWITASKKERTLLSNRQGRTCYLVKWTLQSATKVFNSL